MKNSKRVIIPFFLLVLSAACSTKQTPTEHTSLVDFEKKRPAIADESVDSELSAGEHSDAHSTAIGQLQGDQTELIVLKEDKFSIDLAGSYDGLKVLSPTQALVVSRKKSMLSIVDMHIGQELYSYNLMERYGVAEISDISFSPEFDSLLIAAVIKDVDGEMSTSLIVINLGSNESKQIQLKNFYRNPVARQIGSSYFVVGEANYPFVEFYNLELASATSNSSGYISSKSRIYIDRNTGANFIAYSAGYPYVIVASSEPAVVSLINLNDLSLKDQIRFENESIREITSIKISQPTATDVRSEDPSVLVLDRNSGYLARLNIDNEFQDFARITAAALPRKHYSPTYEPRISADINHRSFYVSQKESNEVHSFADTSKSIELIGTSKLPFSYGDFDVSPSGEVGVFLTQDGKTLSIINNLNQLLSKNNLSELDEETLSAQRILSKLEYEIGSIDGILGKQTIRAISTFQASVGLTETGVLDLLTNQALKTLEEEFDEDYIFDNTFMGYQSVGKNCKSRVSTQRCSGVRISNGFSQKPVYFDAQKNVETKEVVCLIEGSNSSDFDIQLDSYRVSDDDLEYKCSSLHTCGFIRYRHLIGYYYLCGEGSNEVIQIQK